MLDRTRTLPWGLLSLFFSIFISTAQSDSYTSSIGATITWTSTNHSITWSISAATTGWLGLGFPSNSGIMIPSNAVIGYLDGTTPEVVHVDDYYMNDRIPCSGGSGVCTVVSLGGTPQLANLTVSYENGVMNFSFVRLRDASDSMHPSFADSSVPVIFAIGATVPLSEHTVESSVTLFVPLGANQTGPTPEPTPDTGTAIQIAHGVLMFICWMVCIPSGIFLAAFGKSIGVWWFRLHIILQGGAALLSFIAFFLAVAFVSQEQEAHFSSPHQVIGLITELLMFGAPILGFLADKWWDPERTRTPIFPDIIHWIFGYSAVTLAFINIFLGLVEIGSGAVFYILIAIWTVLVIVLYMIGTWWRLRKVGKGV